MISRARSPTSAVALLPHSPLTTQLTPPPSPSPAGRLRDVVGDSQWAPPSLPPGLTRVELRNFLVPELGAAQLQQLPDLRELQLNQCNLSRLLDDAFSRLPQLERLDLSENQLVRLGPDVFTGLSALHTWTCRANRLANLTRPFAHLSWLQHLNLKDNNLTALTHDTFQGLDRVQYVNLDGNLIASVDVAAFQHLTGLAHLILSNNPLSSLATLDFFGSRLQYIDVSNIGIARVPQALTQFVRDLRLAKNAIREIHRGDLDSYPYLGLLVLDDNGLQLLEEDALGRHEYLARLWLNGNSLQAVPLSLPPALRALYIEENMIESLREGDFRGLASLEQLFLRRNHIASVADCALCDLVSLKTLDLQANRLTTLAGRVFSRLASLETLDLSQNPLLALDAAVFAGLTSVRVLQMSRVHSDNVTVPETAFDPLKGLQILEMYGSPHLVALILNSTRMLHSLRGVRELNLMHNDLKALRNDFPAFFPKLQVAKFSGNTWDCTNPSKILWMKRWMVARSPVTFYRSYSIR
ncbi:Slit-like protein [Penaeus vannamei]|uniref:Fibromodulin n=1 Tax=Penaeus vannamei TaxID=6689 RepID=A0A423T1P8_PENVA|nr:Slit-like protein [Penaeus vannamei]